MNTKLPLPPAPVLVAGLGRAGEAALQVLTKAWGASAVYAWDASLDSGVRARAARWRARGVRVWQGGDGIDALRAVGSYATLVKSPGISMDAPLLQAAAQQKLDIVDELEIGWRLASTPMIAVTGTNGKSTTVALIASVLSAAGQEAQAVGNTEFGQPLSLARPGPKIVCEVSSFQLESAPTFLPETAVFTNLTLEHLPRHGTMASYGETKQRMFIRASTPCDLAIVNADNSWGVRIISAVKANGGKVISYGFSDQADVRILKAQWNLQHAEMVLLARNRVVRVPSRLPGRYNALNLAAAYAVGESIGIGSELIVAGLQCGRAPPGRCELIDEDQPFDVIVDYAHTPDGIRQVLNALRVVASKRGTAVRTVFGAVGVPDTPKALACANVARSLSDQLILTTGSASPGSRILRLRELRDGAVSIGPVELILEREQAIAHAIASACPGDIVAILGRGALRRITLDASGTRLHCDDRDVARNSLRALASCVS